MNTKIEKNLPFYNKYRPQSLEEVLGQDVFVKIVHNSITKNKLPNTYILSGIRGIGKTSLARIIAKTINCTDHQIKKSELDLG